MRETQEDAAGEEESDGRAELGKHAVPGAFVGWRVFDGEQDGAAPLAAEPEALAEAAEREQDGRGQSDGAVGGQHSDGDGGQAHGGERDDQRGFAADAVAEVAEERRADGPRQEGDAEGGERGEAGGGRIRCGKEERGKDEDGGRSVDVEVEELDGGADEAGEQDLQRSVDAAGRIGGRGGAHRVSVRAGEAVGLMRACRARWILLAIEQDELLRVDLVVEGKLNDAFPHSYDLNSRIDEEPGHVLKRRSDKAGRQHACKDCTAG